MYAVKCDTMIRGLSPIANKEPTLKVMILGPRSFSNLFGKLEAIFTSNFEDHFQFRSVYN